MVYMHPTAAYQKFSWKLLLTLSLASTYFALRQWFTFVPFSLTGFGVSLLYYFAQFQLNQFQTWAPRSASHHRTRHSKRTEPAPAVQKPASRRPTMPIQTFPAHPIKSSQERRIHTAIPTDRSEVAIESNLIESSPKFAGIQAAVRAVLYRVPAGTICARQRSATFYHSPFDLNLLLSIWISVPGSSMMSTWGNWVSRSWKGDRPRHRIYWRL